MYVLFLNHLQTPTVDTCSPSKLQQLCTMMGRVIVLLSLFAVGCNGFAGISAPVTTTRSSQLFMAVELKPEPEGGEEITALSTMAGSRMKNMGENKSLKNGDGTVYDFWLLSEAEGNLIKEIRTQILKDASKKANFPGFRKGQIPPYAQPQITTFAVQEAVIKTVEAGVEAYGLKALPGSDGEIEVQEDVADMAKGWKTGDSLTFTTTFSAIFDPEKASADAEEAVAAEEG